MTIHDLFWIEAPASPRTVYHHNALALLVFVFGVVPAFGGFGYATLTIGPSFLRLFWLIPGVIVWSAALIYVLAVIRQRLGQTAPFVDAEYCTHEYPGGAAYCIYCGEPRASATKETVRI